MEIGALHDPVTWYGINYIGTQVAQRDFQNKEKSGWTCASSFVLEVPLCNFRPRIINSVSRAGIQQFSQLIILAVVSQRSWVGIPFKACFLQALISQPL